ncbi:MAG: hypothetical protein KGJ77_04305 [Acidobacteriota bacterium]|nr:hypothetical protein [Acidobacteriota bacterium]
MYGAPVGARQGTARLARRWLALEVAAGCTFLAVPVDIVLLDWVSRTTSAKPACDTPLPRYQEALATVVPVCFVLLGIACAVVGIVMIVHGRRHGVRPERDAGVVTVALAAPALLCALALGAVTWFAVGFSTWCF